MAEAEDGPGEVRGLDTDVASGDEEGTGGNITGDMRLSDGSESEKGEVVAE